MTYEIGRKYKIGGDDQFLLNFYMFYMCVLPRGINGRRSWGENVKIPYSLLVIT